MVRSLGPEHWSDAALLAAIADGDDTAFSVFYRRHLPMVTAFLLRSTGDREATADLCAEVFSAILVAAARYRDIGPAGPWVLGIARNKLRESHRKGHIQTRARRRLMFEPLAIDEGDLHEVQLLAFRGEGDLLALLENLPEHERQAVHARVLEEQSYEQIAAELRCSQMVVRKRVSRGLARIRSRLEEQ